MEIQKIKVANNTSLIELMHDIERGKIKIPPFQRKFVWSRSKVIKLLDSIYHEFPIGSFFFWQISQKDALSFRDIAELELPKPEKFDEIDFILDGQQRITSLYVAIRGKKIEIQKIKGKKNRPTDYGKISFDLIQECFVLKRKKITSNTHIIPLCEILGDNHLKINNDLTTDEQKTNFARCHNIFHYYPLPLIKVRDTKLEDAIEIFERINQGGQKLSIFDLVVASTWNQDFDLRIKYEDFEKKIKETGFGKINPELVLYATSLIINGYCRQQYLLKIKKEEISQKWSKIENALELAIDYLRNNLGVKIFDFVPYPSMISLLAYLFYNISGHHLDSRQSEYVNKWFWSYSLGERYSTSRDTAMEEDKKKIFDPILNGKEPNIKISIDLDVEKLKSMRMSNKSAIRNIFLCLLAKKEPKHFKNNSYIPLDYSFCSDFNNKEKHHIFSRSYLKKIGVNGKKINSLLNFCFIPAELNKEISAKKPSEYFFSFRKGNEENFDEILSSHLIPSGKFIENDDFDEFLNERGQLILEEFQRLIGSKINQTLGSDKNKAIDLTEDKLRSFIDISLSKEYGSNYWKNSIPGDIQETIKERLDNYLKKNPAIDPADLTNADKLCQCDVMDYCKIIIINWKIFEDKFKSKSEIQVKFNNFKEFRNAVKHNKPIDSILRKEGEAAIEWLNKILR